MISGGIDPFQCNKKENPTTMKFNEEKEKLSMIALNLCVDPTLSNEILELKLIFWSSPLEHKRLTLNYYSLQIF